MFMDSRGVRRYEDYQMAWYGHRVAVYPYEHRYGRDIHDIDDAPHLDAAPVGIQRPQQYRLR